MRWSGVLGWVATVAFVGGCSGLVSPDESRLDPTGRGMDAGGRDTGIRVDSGPGIDAGVDRDGTVVPPTPPVPPPPPIDAGPDARPPVDMGPRPCPGGCDDGVACTVDVCNDGTCMFTADGTRCGAGEICSPTDGCLARRCTSDDECQDGNPCNGQETCSGSAPGTGCVSGAPLDCDDGIPCTVDRCGDVGCTHEARNDACNDGIDCTLDECLPGATGTRDGCLFTPDSTRCEGNFCDGVACVFGVGCRPSMPPDCLDGNACTADACDRTIEACVSELRDEDGDGHNPAMVDGDVCEGGDDCNDGNPMVFRGAMEICGNSIDENCDGADTPCMGTGGDTCATALPLAIDGAGRASVSGNTTSFLHNHRSSCSESGSTAPDVVYSIEIRGHHDVAIDTIGSTFDTVVSVATSCGSGTSTTPSYVVCDDDIRQGGPTTSRVWLRDVGNDFAATTFYIFVDGYNTGAAGTYTLNVVVGPSSSSGVCGGGSPMPPSFDASAGGTLYGEVPLRGGAQAGSCGGGGIAVTPVEDLIRLRSEDDGGVELRLVRGSEIGTATLYARQGMNCTSSTEVTCANTDGTTVETSFSASAATTYWMFVDTNPGRYTLDVDPP